MNELFLDARSAQQSADGLALRVSDLERRVDRISLVSQALWELLREKTGLAEEDVFTRMHEIDARDGEADGRIARQVTPCPNCNRPVSTRRNTCLYCGAAVEHPQLIS